MASRLEKCDPPHKANFRINSKCEKIKHKCKRPVSQKCKKKLAKSMNRKSSKIKVHKKYTKSTQKVQKYTRNTSAITSQSPKRCLGQKSRFVLSSVNERILNNS